ncbi:MAG: hypothetical protein HZA47_01880 [Planctomycetes bacterium]|uniref:hypothetical protein n=1 Tax=Candidatus Wunengus sp. YC65 TaxID=3367701 RepID=UPI001DCD7947|nr:hypothetical protein [Planctomycetota bacterium]MBI5795049.1 hypothetical protein [Planctomycetota bacterium]
MEKAYFKEMLVEMWDAAQLVLPIIRSLANQEPDSKCFKERYCEVLGTIGIDKQFWPEYMKF